MLGNSKEVSPSAAPFVSGAYSAHCLTHMKISRKQRFIFSWLKILFLTSKQSPNECFSILLCMMSYVQGCHLSIKGKSRLRTFLLSFITNRQNSVILIHAYSNNSYINWQNSAILKHAYSNNSYTNWQNSGVLSQYPFWVWTGHFEEKNLFYPKYGRISKTVLNLC